jgi:hypothetical protein
MKTPQKDSMSSRWEAGRRRNGIPMGKPETGAGGNGASGHILRRTGKKGWWLFPFYRRNHRVQNNT